VGQPVSVISQVVVKVPPSDVTKQAVLASVEALDTIEVQAPVISNPYGLNAPHANPYPYLISPSYASMVSYPYYGYYSPYAN
jgi:hypothetical protein